MTREIRIKNIPLGGNNPLVLIAGPCVIEGLDVTLHVAGALKEIASSLNISDNTVKYHLRNIMEKLHFKNRAQMAVYATKRGIEPDCPNKKPS